jgi:hypothetical protein
MLDVQITEAEASELRGKGIDILTSHVVEQTMARTVSNHPADIEATKAEAAKADPAKEPERPRGEEKPNGVQKRIDELTRQTHDARRQAQAEAAARIKAEDEARQLREQVASLNRPAPPVEPKREDFDDQDAYVDARVKYETDKALQAQADERAQADKEAQTKRAKDEADRKAAEGVQAKIDRFEAQKTEAREKHTDFDEVTENPDLILSPALTMALLDSDVAGELAYHFGKNPEVVKELNGLPQAGMLKKLGQIELSLAAPDKGQADNGAGDQPRGPDGKFVSKETPAKDVSSASPPINPVGSSEGSGKKDPATMTQAEFEAWWTAGRK